MIEKLIRFCAVNRFLTLITVTVLTLWGVWCIKNIALDAIPDLSDTQVIIYSRWPGQSPGLIEDQVTYPIITSLLGAPGVKTIRGFSDFGFSYVYVIFKDGTDIYWARSRVLEYMSSVLPKLPEGVQTELGPDATGVGWVFQYALVDKSGKNDLAELRSFQDWYLRYYLQSVPGVAEVASVGGFVKQYQVTVDPNRLLAYELPLSRVVENIRKNNNEVGGRILEWGGTEYMVRGRGYIQSTQDLESIVLKTTADGTPVLLREVASVALGPDIRRGIADLDGEGDTVGGIVVMRYGENALEVIERVKKKLKELEAQGAFPEGVEVVTTYDRSVLIHRAIDTLREELLLEMIIVALVILLFLLHIPSSLVPIFTVPIAVILSFIPMYYMGLNSNIMSLGGIAVAIGALVDASIVVVENSHKKIEAWKLGGRKEKYNDVLIGAIQEVGRPAFFSLLVIAVAFMPIFALQDQEGRLFKPLAFTKNFAMAFAAILAITLGPALVTFLIRDKKFSFRPQWLCRAWNTVAVGTIHREDEHPISRFLYKIYGPVAHLVLRHPKTVILLAVLTVAGTVPVYLQLGKEFMPPLNEGSILYMPTTLPGISVTEAQELLSRQDQILKSFPEVERVFGKAGRATTSTDPAPFSMMETTVILKPESEWRPKERWYSSWAPEWLKGILRHGWSDRISWEELINEMDKAMRFPGLTNAWTMPIKARIDMLSTGIRTPIGIKIFGADLEIIEQIGMQLEGILPQIEGTRSVFAERVVGGYFVDFIPRREEIARYGLGIEDVQATIMTAIGGMNIDEVVEGRERYPINVRYPRELRDNMDSLKRVLVQTPSGAQIPLEQLTNIELSQGPAMIRDENGMLAGYVYVDMDTAARDIGSYVDEAKLRVNEQLDLPPGYSLMWSGQYESMARVKARLQMVVPITLFIIFVLIYFNTKSAAKTLIVLMAIPFSAVGSFWLLYLLGYNMSIGVWVGLIALLGLDAETGVFMLVYLDLAYDSMKKKGKMNTADDLREAVYHGAVKRVRPKVMTVATTFLGLTPILWSTGAGASVMKRIAAPMVGGLATSFLMELLVYPAVYFLWRWHSEVRHAKPPAPSQPQLTNPQSSNPQLTQGERS